jgi:hypothetical protein
MDAFVVYSSSLLGYAEGYPAEIGNTCALQRVACRNHTTVML